MIARWNEDGVWYNAMVDRVDSATEEAPVTFMDYGNTATVAVKNILNSAGELPVEEHDMVDQLLMAGQPRHRSLFGFGFPHEHCKIITSTNEHLMSNSANHSLISFFRKSL